MTSNAETVLPPVLTRTRQTFPISKPISDEEGNVSYVYDGVHSKINKNLLHSVTGNLSTWPAYGAGQTILPKRKPCAGTDIKCHRTAKENANTVSKPRYLEQLESYLRRELQSLDLTKVNVQELRLQPYREVFEYFIEDFKTYKQLLSAIKNEYEITLAFQREQIRSLEPLKAMLVSVSERCDKKIQEIREQERLEVKTLKIEKFNLLKVIDKMKEEKSSLQAQISKLQEELDNTFLMYRNECDARKLLISDINELKYQQEDYKLSQDPQEQREDPVTLAIALRVARTDLTNTQVLLNKMIADFGDVVPRRDFENQEKNLAACQQKLTLLQKDFSQLQSEHKSLLEINQQVLQQRDSFCMEVDEMQRSSTPRPTWEKSADVISGGLPRWSQLSLGKSSDQLVDVLLTELGTKILKEKDVFPGMGKRENIPYHLRHEGPVKNLKLSLKDVSNLLKEIWKEKMAIDQQKGKQSSLPEFLLNFLQKKFGDAAIEWSYTLHETCRVQMTNEQMHYFYKVLIGQVEENLYSALLHIHTYLLKELTIADSSNDGLLTREQFRLQLEKVFPLKSANEMQEILDIADSKINPEDGNIPYKSLFTEEENGRPSHFIGMLRNQFLAEKKQYLKELRNKLGNKNVKPEELKAAFLSVDPTIDDQTLDKYVTQAFQVPKDQLEETSPLSPTLLFRHLAAGDIRRIGPAALVEGRLNETKAKLSL
ncbi:translin-associated factor X-interacting protein 1 isoform X1 [Pseudophryne corroboree]|uniref:translin-associated factor X-interacting protein 1 isoform X1 n=1 Tax=Pseudophryne corroboree TaxID=495146 RepID=UPI0030816162